VFLVFIGIASRLTECIENAYLAVSADARRIGDTFENAMSFVTTACAPAIMQEHGDNVGFRA
jgi:hypothetical protein